MVYAKNANLAESKIKSYFWTFIGFFYEDLGYSVHVLRRALCEGEGGGSYFCPDVIV
jgi:hypothetical protein